MLRRRFPVALEKFLAVSQPGCFSDADLSHHVRSGECMGTSRKEALESARPYDPYVCATGLPGLLRDGWRRRQHTGAVQARRALAPCCPHSRTDTVSSSRLTAASIGAAGRPRIRWPTRSRKETSMQSKQRMFVVFVGSRPSSSSALGAVPARRTSGSSSASRRLRGRSRRGDQEPRRSDAEGRQTGEAERRRRGRGVEEGRPAMGQSQG